MKVIELIELVQYSLLGIPTIDDRSKHEEVIRATVGRAYNQMIGSLIQKGYKNLSLFTKLYKNVEVVKDTDLGTYYSLLPVDISFLPDIKSGVRSVSPVNDSTSEFMPLNREKISIIFNADKNGIDTSIGYLVGINENSEISIEYFGMNDNNVINPVKMYLIRPFEDYDDMEDVHIPVGEDQALIALTIKILSGQPQKDLKNSSSEIKY